MTQSKHSGAERSWFAGLMMSGKITNEQYCLYLKQQYECYNALESRFKLINDASVKQIPDTLNRSTGIKEDIEELSGDFENISIFDSTQDYTNYILNECDESLLYAHVYVRYLGDLKGGQMIAKRIPGSGKYYQFEDAENLESFIREQLREDDVFVEECNKCFGSAIALFKDLESHLK